MNRLIKIQTSIFGRNGQSSQLADRFVADWLNRNPHGAVALRDLSADPVPHLDLTRFQALSAKPEERTKEQQAVVDYSDALIEEMQQSDVLVFSVPMYNFNVPTALHAYFDHIARAGVTFRYTAEGPEGLIKGKRAIVFVTRGGVHGDGHAQTAYLRQMLGFIGITDVEFVHAEGLAIDDDTREKSLSRARHEVAKLVHLATEAA